MARTNKQLAGAQRRSLRAMREKLLDMAAAWDGMDQYNMGELTDLADHVERVAAGMVGDDDAAGELA